MSDARNDINGFFDKGTFPYKGNVFKTKKEEWTKERIKQFFEYIENESKDISYDLFEDYFDFSVPSALAKKLYETKNKNKNNELVELIKVRWSNLKDEIEKMSEDQKNLKNQIKYWKLLKKFLILIKRFKISEVQV